MATATLFDYWRSTASYRVRIALHLAGIDFQSVPVDLLNGEQRTSAHLSRNPQGFVPVLDIDGLRLTQSLAIIDYLDETRGLCLLPSGPVERARVRALAHVIAMDTHPICNPSVVSETVKLFEDPDRARTHWMRYFVRRGLTAFEELLDKTNANGFCYGNIPSIADLCLIPQLYNANRWGLDTTDLTQISKVARRCATHPAFIAAAPQLPSNSNHLA